MLPKIPCVKEIPAAKVTLLLMLGIIVMGSNSFVLSPILGDVADGLQTTPIIVARVISAFGAATAISSLLFGGLIDYLGERRVLAGGASIMCLALIGCAVSTTWYWLALCQAVIGMCVGVMLPACYASATANAPQGQGARVLGRVISAWGIALVFGVPFSAFVSDLAGWRMTFAALAAFAALSVIGFLQLPEKSASNQNVSRISIIAALRINGALPLLAICLMFMTAFYGLYAFLGDHLRVTLDLTAGEAGIVVLGYGAGFAVASIADGAVDRIGPKKSLPLSLVLVAAIYILLIQATQNYAAAIIAAALWGFANHICMNLIVFLLSQRDPKARGVLMSLQTTVTYISVFLGPLMLGMLYPKGFYVMATAAAFLLMTGAIIAKILISNFEPSKP